MSCRVVCADCINNCVYVVQCVHLAYVLMFTTQQSCVGIGSICNGGHQNNGTRVTLSWIHVRASWTDKWIELSMWAGKEAGKIHKIKWMFCRWSSEIAPPSIIRIIIIIISIIIYIYITCVNLQQKLFSLRIWRKQANLTHWRQFIELHTYRIDLYTVYFGTANWISINLCDCNFIFE